MSARVSYGLGTVIGKNRLAQRTRPHSPALTFEDRTLSYEELDERTTRVASALAARGFAPGDRAAILLYNCVEYVELFFAIAKLGGVIVPVNYLLKPEEVKFILDDAGAGWVFSQESLAHLLDPIIGSLQRPATVVGIDAGVGSEHYETLVGEGDDAWIGPPVTPDDLLLFQYTSGTTGFPKGAMHTHGTVLWNALQQLPDFGIVRSDVHLCMPALCWAAGFHVFTLPTLWAGGHVVLNPSRALDPAAVLATIERHGVTTVVFVPSILRMILSSPDVESANVASLRLIVSGAEPVPVELIEETYRRIADCDLVQSFGMSEFPTTMAFLEASQAIPKRGSAGRAATCAQLRVVDENGDDLPAGERGEIVCRSPASMVGYYGRPEATADTVRDGWLHTGDSGYVDEDGYLFITGRIKDMIISGGLNVYPAEIERVLSAHEAVAEVAVVGVPHERFGEVGKAFVVVGGGRTVTAEELEALAREHLANFKVPKEWAIGTEPLPRTTSGKIQKFLLRERARP